MNFCAKIYEKIEKNKHTTTFFFMFFLIFIRDMNNKKVYINSRQYNLIKESEWNFHFGGEHNMEPYHSDSKFRMAGRETGHFGSGTYFSTYKDKESLNQYRDDANNPDPNFIQVGENVYRVDFDLYKNLYRVESKKQGDILYTLLANVNHLANRVAYMGHFSRSIASYNNADVYQIIKANADGLGLKCPSYYELTRMAQKLGRDDSDIRSLSTVFMEYNGYNGVNVSGVEYYDNTKHGSVIYDLSKVDGEVEQVNPKSLFTGFRDSPYDDTIVRKGYNDPGVESLKGEYIGWYDKLNNMPINEALRLLKNYTDSGNILSYFNVKNLKPELIKRYLRLIFVKKPNSRWSDPIDEEFVNGNESKYYARLIDEYEAYYWVNYVSRNVKWNSVFVNLLDNFERNIPWDINEDEEKKLKEDYYNKLMSYMQRELSDWEKEYIEEDYFDN